MTNPLTPELAYLTLAEIEAIELTVQLAGAFGRIVSDGEQRSNDLREFCAALHVIQRMVMAQGMARAFPEHFRLLGEKL
jgi:hypothetical protein